MTSFRYKAACADGSVTDGVLSGTDREHVVRQLRALGHMPIRIDETRVAASPQPARTRGRKIGAQLVADSTRELATLLRAGVPLDRALTTLATLSGATPLGQVLTAVRDAVKEGNTLADAASAHPSVFDRFYVNLLRAGEMGGALEVVLERLADHLDRGIEIRDALKSALIYPAVLIVVALISIFILLGYVVPQFTEMFESVGQVLPLSTRVTIAVGEFLQAYGWALIVLLSLGAVLFRRQLNTPAGALRWHRRLLRAPLIGQIAMKIEVARFARTLATLLDNGIALLPALGIVKETMANAVLADGVGRASSGLKAGQGLAEPLAATADFPPFAVQMIKVGEESGSLPETLLRVAEAYDRDSQLTIKRALALLEPALILVLGAIIAAVIISILVAILGVNDLVI